MLTAPATLADKLCRMVADEPSIPNATARLSAWLVGVAAQTGGFPLELSVQDIRNGFTRNGVTVQGTGARHETIKASLQWLGAHGYLTSTDGGYAGFGYSKQVYSLHLGS